MQTRLLEQRQGRIAYDDTEGRGQLVICAPGMGDVRGVYRFLRPALAAAGYRVVTMDVRGHGESTTGWDDYSAAAVGRDIVALARALDAGPAHVIGGSMAAGAAVWAAAEDPGLVASVTLIGPFVRDIEPSAGQRVAVGLMRVLLASPWGPRVWAWWYRKLYPGRPPADLDRYAQQLRDNLSEPGRMAALRAMLAASKADCEQRLSAVTAPALVVMGDKDPDFPDPAAEATLIAERLSAQTLMVDGTGHYPQAESPDLVGAAIVEFLQASVRNGR